ncbi:MAG: pyridoxal-phosphate dependent enzyme [Bradymonadaceae bacterium]
MTVDQMDELIGATPLLELESFGGEGSPLHVKMENYNPSGSIRDRHLAEIIRRAFEAGQLVEGDVVSVAGIDDCSVSAAFLAGRLGVTLKVFAPEHSNPRLVRQYGADIEWLEADTEWRQAVDRAAQWARRAPDRMFVNGYRREAVRDSYAVIADEILESLGERPVGAFITSVTTGGAYRQVAGELRETHPDMLVGGAVLSDRTFPSLADNNRNMLRNVSMADAWEMRDRLAREAGLLVGPKGAAAVELGLELRDRLDPEAAIVALNPDAGQRYLGWEGETFSDFNREQTSM